MPFFVTVPNKIKVLFMNGITWRHLDGQKSSLAEPTQLEIEGPPTRLRFTDTSSKCQAISSDTRNTRIRTSRGSDWSLVLGPGHLSVTPVSGCRLSLAAALAKSIEPPSPINEPKQMTPTCLERLRLRRRLCSALGTRGSWRSLV